MPCPLGDYGQPLCNVVRHPDRAYESFCANCNQRFYDRGSNPVMWVWLAMVAIAWLLLSPLFRGSAPEPVPAVSQGEASPASTHIEALPASTQIIASPTVQADPLLEASDGQLIPVILPNSAEG